MADEKEFFSFLHSHFHTPDSSLVIDFQILGRSPSPPLSEGDGEGLTALQAQHRSRSKMHEMAVRQKLITDQVGKVFKGSCNRNELYRTENSVIRN